MIAEQLKAHRKSIGVSQVRLANEAGVSRFRYTLFELGDGTLSPEELSSVEKALERIARAEMNRLSEFIQGREQVTTA